MSYFKVLAHGGSCPGDGLQVLCSPTGWVRAVISGAVGWAPLVVLVLERAAQLACVQALHLPIAAFVVLYLGLTATNLAIQCWLLSWFDSSKMSQPTYCASSCLMLLATAIPGFLLFAVTARFCGLSQPPGEPVFASCAIGLAMNLTCVELAKRYLQKHHTAQ